MDPTTKVNSPTTKSLDKVHVISHRREIRIRDTSIMVRQSTIATMFTPFFHHQVKWMGMDDWGNPSSRSQGSVRLDSVRTFRSVVDWAMVIATKAISKRTVMKVKAVIYHRTSKSTLVIGTNIVDMDSANKLTETDVATPVIGLRINGTDLVNWATHKMNQWFMR